MSLIPEVDQTVEHVLCVPTLLFHEIGHFQGFMPDVDRYLGTLLDRSYTSYRPRNEVEEDPSYKQLIPYCIFRADSKVFHYTRGTEQGEKRLHAKRSLGVGGHISTLDADQETNAYSVGMWRELNEEIFIESDFTVNCVGLINDDQTPVGRVHLGVVHIFDLEAAKVRPREQSMRETGFSEPSELMRQRDSFETWSQICLDHLF